MTRRLGLIVIEDLTAFGIKNHAECFKLVRGASTRRSER